MSRRERCLDCFRLPATWVRRTQFSGDHYFCTRHAKREANFGMKDPSYFVWEKLPRAPRKPR